MDPMSDIDGDEHCREGFDRCGLRQASCVDAAQPWDEVRQLDRLRGGFSIVRADQDICRHGLIQLLHLRSRQVMKGRAHQRLRQRGLQTGGHRPARWHEGQELLPLFDQGVGHGDHHLASQGIGQRLDRGRDPVPRGGHHDEIACGRVLIGRTGNGERSIRPAIDQPLRHLSRPFGVTGTDHDVLSDSGESYGQSPSGRTRTTKNSDLHVPTLAHRLGRSGH